jgi:hypothetical protein
MQASETKRRGYPEFIVGSEPEIHQDALKRYAAAAGDDAWSSERRHCG